MDHGFHGYVSHNQMVFSPTTPEKRAFFPSCFASLGSQPGVKGEATVAAVGGCLTFFGMKEIESTLW
jgi:hypothetical protein